VKKVNFPQGFFRFPDNHRSEPSNAIMKTKSIVAAFSMFASSLAFAAGEAPKKQEVKPYKPDTCIVSDEKLGEMGEPFVFTHEGQEIKLCCKSCKKKFDKDPAKYLKKLEGK
jgi:YHS domain-containing protein